MATQFVSTMYGDLLSTKSRKYSQRQRKLKWHEQKAYVTVQQSISHVGYIVYGVHEQPHEAKHSVSL